MQVRFYNEGQHDSRDKGKVARMDLHVKRWLSNIPAQDLHLSVITVMELERGFNLLRRNVAHFQRTGVAVINPWN
jgi:hypothetical protein